jgi:hypothetical protein
MTCTLKDHDDDDDDDEVPDPRNNCIPHNVNLTDRNYHIISP